MGQSQSTPYLPVLKHTLAVYGVHISSSDIEMCIKVIREWNPWFPEEGTMELNNWRWVRSNVEKAWQQGERMPVRFWYIWSVLHTVFKAMSEERAVSDFKKETTPSILDLQLDADIKDAIETDTIVYKKGS